MTRVFADTLYWVASIIPSDPWHDPAERAIAALNPPVQIVTTEDVLVEVLSSCAGMDNYWRSLAAAIVRSLLASPYVTVLPRNSESFLSALTLYESRPDKTYSLVDCVSMNAMRDEGISKILTNDHHFTQEGFTVLIQR